MRRAGIWWMALGAVLASTAATGQDRLAADMLERLRARYPEMEFRLIADQQILSIRNGKEGTSLFLDNLREICANRPAVCEEQKQNRIQMFADMAKPAGTAFRIQDVRAVLRPVAYLEGARQQFEVLKRGRTPEEQRKVDESFPIYQPFGRGLVRMWVLDSERGMATLAQTTVEEQKLTVADLDQASSVNMEQEKVPHLTVTRLHPSLWVSDGNDYVGSVLVDDKLWQRVAGPLAKDDVVACLPERHLLIAYVPRLDANKEVDFDRLCRTVASRGAPSFSDQTIARRQGRWQAP